MRKIQLAPTATLFHADCRDALRSQPDCSVDSVVTDPPYELNFMGKGWDNTGIANDPALWAEVLRVLKPGGHLAAFSASRTYHRMTCAIEDAGFEIRDSLMWVYGTGFPKSQDVSKFIDKELGVEGAKGAVTGRSSTKEIGTTGHVGGEYHEYIPGSPQAREFDGFGTALKPAFEPIVLARKPLSEGTVAANVLRWRTGALNIDDTRVQAHDGTSTARKPSLVKDTSAPFGKGVAMGGNGSDLGRWPANVVHDGSDEVVGAFPDSKGQQGDVKGTEQRNNNVFGKMPPPSAHAKRGDSGSAARFFYSAKASKADRNGSKHPTVKPISLMEWLCTLITPPGGTILDPFGGSGTTAIAASNKGFPVILCEREAEYIADIMGRFGPVGPAIPSSDALRRFHAWNAKALELQAFLNERVRA